MSEVQISFSRPNKILNGVISLPSSKSISNRALIIQALSKNKIDLHHLSDASDTKILLHILSNFKISDTPQVFDVGDAGTSFRFLTAFFSCIENVDITLKGTDRMHQRPIGQLVEALNQLGADIHYLQDFSYPPLHIFGKKLKGTTLKINGEVSSQFISALCLIAPTLSNGLSLEVQNDIVSLSYIEMTLKLMAQFGIQSSFNHNCIHIPPQPYQAQSMSIESDWSSACFFYAMAMVSTTSEMQLRFLEKESLQGDACIHTIAEDFGIQSIFRDDHVLIKKIDAAHSNGEKIYDLSSYPDLAIPLIVACAIKFPHVRFTGLGHLRYKESDRLQALMVELRKMGIILQEHHEVLSIDNSNYHPSRQRIELDTYHDHRLAMAFCLFAIDGYTVVLNDGKCVSKSFPNYFEQLKIIGFDISYS